MVKRVMRRSVSKDISPQVILALLVVLIIMAVFSLGIFLQTLDASAFSKQPQKLTTSGEVGIVIRPSQETSATKEES